jgi:uncharacterized protein (DUF1778 family)
VGDLFVKTTYNSLEEDEVRNLAQNSERVDFRATPNMKQLIQQAALIMGMDVSSFLRATVVPAARQVVESFETRVLNDRDRDRFLSILDDSSEPNDKLREAANNFRVAIERGDIHV